MHVDFWGERVMKSRAIFREVLCMFTQTVVDSSSAGSFFFSIKSIFEVYNEGARETNLMHQWSSNEKQKENSEEVTELARVTGQLCIKTAFLPQWHTA